MGNIEIKGAVGVDWPGQVEPKFTAITQGDETSTDAVWSLVEQIETGKAIVDNSTVGTIQNRSKKLSFIQEGWGTYRSGVEEGASCAEVEDVQLRQSQGIVEIHCVVHELGAQRDNIEIEAAERSVAAAFPAIAVAQRQ